MKKNDFYRLVVLLFTISYWGVSKNTNLKIDHIQKVGNSQYLNAWIKKSTGFNSSFSNEQIKFNTDNYKLIYPKTKKNTFPLFDVDDSNLASTKPKIIIKNDHIILEFSGGWNYNLFATENFFISSMHHGSSGEATIFNLKTGEIENLDYEVRDIKGNVVKVQAAYHDENGGYQSDFYYYNLLTKKKTRIR